MAYTGTTIKDLSTSTPAEGSAIVPELNDSDREIKTVLKNQYAITTLTALATLDATHSVVLCNGTFTVTLPSIATVSSATHLKEYTIINIGTGVITIGGTVNGVVNPTLSAQYSGRKIVGDGTNWTWLKEVTFDANGRINEVANTLWDGTAARSASPTPAANTVPVSDSSGELAVGWFSAGLKRVKTITALPKEATISIASPAVVSCVAHGHSIGDSILFTTTGALPTGLVVDTAYYIISTGFTVDAFQLSATSGGTAINTSGSQNGTHTLYPAWVTDSSTTIAVIAASGGGGGGGGSAGAENNSGVGTGSGGGGGGGGEGGESTIKIVTPAASTTYKITLGAGGTAGSAGTNPNNNTRPPTAGTGGTGGTTSVGALVSLSGGIGGSGGTGGLDSGGTTPAGGVGGDPRSPTGNQVSAATAGYSSTLTKGGDGGIGHDSLTSDGSEGANAGGGGYGGGTVFLSGMPSPSRISQTAGTTGVDGMYGTGGSGGVGGSTAFSLTGGSDSSANGAAGGQGGSGIVIIWW